MLLLKKSVRNYLTDGITIILGWVSIILLSHFGLFLSQLVKMNRGCNSLFQLVEFEIDFVLWMQNYSFGIGCCVADAEPTSTTVKVSLFSGGLWYKGDHNGSYDRISRILFMCNNLHSRSSRQEPTLLGRRGIGTELVEWETNTRCAVSFSGWYDFAINFFAAIAPSTLIFPFLFPCRERHACPRFEDTYLFWAPAPCLPWAEIRDCRKTPFILFFPCLMCTKTSLQFAVRQFPNYCLTRVIRRYEKRENKCVK